MGNDQGAIWNQSDFVINYYIYSKFQQISNKRPETTFYPQLSINIQTGIKISGFKRITQTQSSFKYEFSKFQVLPGRVSTFGLGDFKMNERKITIKAYIGNYEKVLASNVIVTKIDDIRLKIRSDLSIKNVGKQQFEKMMHESQEVTNVRMTSGAVDKEREKRRDKYIKQLDKKYEELKKKYEERNTKTQSCHCKCQIF